jgi:hypothetical protein
VEPHLSYELVKQAPTVEIPVQRLVLEEGKPVKIPFMTRVGVIPDAEIVVTNTNTGERLLIILEIDQNTQAPQRLRNHLVALRAYIQSPRFKRRFGDIPYRIVYATQGVTEPASTSRLAYLCEFTLKLLIERNRQEDSQYFRFTTINFATLYEDANRLFGSEQPSWYLPGDVNLENPVGLFTDTKPHPQKEQTHATR